MVIGLLKQLKHCPDFAAILVSIHVKLGKCAAQRWQGQMKTSKARFGGVHVGVIHKCYPPKALLAPNLEVHPVDLQFLRSSNTAQLHQAKSYTKSGCIARFVGVYSEL